MWTSGANYRRQQTIGFFLWLRAWGGVDTGAYIIDYKSYVLCDQRTAGSILTLKIDYTKMVIGLGPIAYPVTWICSPTGSTGNPLTEYGMHGCM